MKWALPLVLVTGASATCTSQFKEKVELSIATKLVNGTIQEGDLTSVDPLILARVFSLCWDEVKSRKNYIELKRMAQELPLASKLDQMAKIFQTLGTDSREKFIEWVTELFSDFEFPRDYYSTVAMNQFLGNSTIERIKDLSMGIQRKLNLYNPQMMVAIPNRADVPFFVSTGYLQRFIQNDLDSEIPLRIMEIYGQFLSYSSIYKKTQRIGYIPLDDENKEVISYFRNCPTCSSMIWPMKRHNLWNLVYIEGWLTKKCNIVFIKFCQSKFEPKAVVQNIKNSLKKTRKELGLGKCEFTNEIFDIPSLTESKKGDNLIYDILHYMKFLTLGNKPNSVRLTYSFLKGEDIKHLVLAELFTGRQFDPSGFATYYYGDK